MRSLPERALFGLAAMVTLAVADARADLFLHYDATVASSITTDGADVVTLWEDQSSFGNDTISTINTPIFPGVATSATGLPMIDFGEPTTTANRFEVFDTADQDSLLDFGGAASGNSGVTVFISYYVDNVLAGNSRDVLFANHGSATAADTFNFRYEGGAPQVILGGQRITHSGGGVSGGDTAVLAFTYDAATGNYSLFSSANNGVDTGSRTAGPGGDFARTATMRLGGSPNGDQRMDGSIGEVLVYNEFMGATDFVTEAVGLVDKWIGSVPIVAVDRVTGAATLTVGAQPLSISSYTIDSDAGALIPSNWNSIADGSNSSLDSDEWIALSGAITDGTNLSEGELPGGDGSVTLAAGATVDLGAIWGSHPAEDLQFNLLDENGDVVSAAVVFDGNGGLAYQTGDLDFDNDVDLDDWAAFRDGYGGVFSDLSGGETYPLGDLDADLDVDVDDFRAFEAAYDAANGVSLSQAIAGVPEPGALVMVALGLGLVATRSRRAAGLAVCLMMFTVCGVSSAQTFTVIDAPDDPVNDVLTTVQLSGGGDAAANLFTDTVTAADIDVTNYSSSDEFEIRGQGPAPVFVDNNESITTNYIAYANRGNSLDFVGSIELWFSDDDFIPDGGDTPLLPATEPDSVVDMSDRLVGNLLQSFSLGDTFDGQYVAMNFVAAPGATANIGGREFRFLQGPDQFILEVDRSTGAMTIKNARDFAQALDIDAYEIASPSGSLDAGDFTGLAGQAGFPAASSDDAGDGWELGESSGSELLAEAYLFGGSTVGVGAELPLGSAYDTGVDAQDLTFSYSLEDGLVLPGNVVYVNEPSTLIGDADGDGDVDGDDLIAVQANFGSVTPPPGDADSDGDVDGDDLIAVQANFGAVAPSAAIPEPSSLWLLGLGGLLAGRRRVRREASSSVSPKLGGVAVALLAACVASTSFASTPDRTYLLGENTDVAPVGPVDENGATNLGGIMGDFNTTNPGFISDHSGDLANLASFADLDNVGDPRYVDVSSRPYASSGAVGGDFDGDDYLWTSLGFGNPTNGDASYQDVISYNGLINHYMQGWVYPTSAGVAGQRQTVVRDTDQFRMHIETDSGGTPRWGHHYANTTQLSDTEAELNEWTHVAQYSNGDNSFFYVNGVVAGVVGGFFQPNGGGPEGATLGATSFSLGADVTGAAADPSNYFTGYLDDFDVRVTGDNSATEAAGADYGAFVLEEDNAYVAGLVADGTIVPGDVNGDGVVNGDGTGAASSDDVSFFIDNYLEQQVVNFVVVGDLNSRTTMADLNYSGTTNILDWFILVENHEDSALASSLDLGALIAGVPEPGSLALAALAAAMAATRRSRK